jgi:hypothetical protein
MVRMLCITLTDMISCYNFSLSASGSQGGRQAGGEQIISTKLICPEYFSLELGDLVTRLLSRYEENRLGNIILYIIMTITNIVRCQSLCRTFCSLLDIPFSLSFLSFTSSSTTMLVRMSTSLSKLSRQISINIS